MSDLCDCNGLDDGAANPRPGQLSVLHNAGSRTLLWLPRQQCSLQMLIKALVHKPKWSLGPCAPCVCGSAVVLLPPLAKPSPWQFSILRTSSEPKSCSPLIEAQTVLAAAPSPPPPPLPPSQLQPRACRSSSARCGRLAAFPQRCWSCQPQVGRWAGRARGYRHCPSRCCPAHLALVTSIPLPPPCRPSAHSAAHHSWQPWRRSVLHPLHARSAPTAGRAGGRGLHLQPRHGAEATLGRLPSWPGLVRAPCSVASRRMCGCVMATLAGLQTCLPLRLLLPRTAGG